MKKFLSIIFTLVISLFGITSVSAVDDSVIFHDEYFSGVKTIPGAGSTYKEVTTSEGNRVAFCFNMKNDAPPQGAKLVKADNGILPNEEKTNQIIYILDNGLGGTWNTSIIKGSYSKHQKYYITQLAVWMAQGSLDPTTVKNSGTLGKAAYKLYNAATKNAKVTAYEPKVSFSGDSKMSLSGSNYVSGTITLKVEGATNATVTLLNAPAGSKILVNGADKGNQVKLTNGTKFQISVPAASLTKNITVKVNAKANATRKKIQIYKYKSNSKYQNIGLIFKEKYTASADISTTIESKGQLEVVKVELVDGKEVNLAGATLAVKDSKGKVIATWDTKDENPKKFTGLTIGETYTVYEVTAPTGYKKAGEIKATITGTTLQVVKVVNSKTTPVIISKQDVTTGKELPGATLVLKDAEGNIIDKWVSTTTPHYITNLPEGTYTLIETQSPTGYGLSDEVVTFEVKYDGKEMAPVVMYNSPIPDTGDMNIGLVVFGMISAIGLGTFGYIKFKRA